jgi:23S rRNA (adenine1618-N6)-methyltransferase
LKKNQSITEKAGLHPRNPHRFNYNFEALSQAYPDLNNFIFINDHQIVTIDFSLPDAVKALNKALLITEYGIQNWDIPSQYLCPPVPGRADYIHYVADLLASNNNGIIPEGINITGLDIGIGANGIYPIIGNAAYGWSFVGTDIDEKALQNCKKIIADNPKLIDSISLQLQIEPRFIFKNIFLPEDKFAFTICNPPFHASPEEAAKSALRKVNALEKTKTNKPVLNFGGQNGELWCKGGELGFLTQMIYESAKYPMQCLWFTTLVSKKDNLLKIYKVLNKVGASEIKTIDMAQGQKISRVVAWTFLTTKQQQEYINAIQL